MLDENKGTPRLGDMQIKLRLSDAINSVNRNQQLWLERGLQADFLLAADGHGKEGRGLDPEFGDVQHPFGLQMDAVFAGVQRGGDLKVARDAVQGEFAGGGDVLFGAGVGVEGGMEGAGEFGEGVIFHIECGVQAGVAIRDAGRQRLQVQVKVEGAGAQVDGPAQAARIAGKDTQAALHFGSELGVAVARGKDIGAGKMGGQCRGAGGVV